MFKFETHVGFGARHTVAGKRLYCRSRAALAQAVSDGVWLVRGHGGRIDVNRIARRRVRQAWFKALIQRSYRRSSIGTRFAEEVDKFLANESSNHEIQEEAETLRQRSCEKRFRLQGTLFLRRTSGWDVRLLRPAAAIGHCSHSREPGRGRGGARPKWRAVPDGERYNPLGRHLSRGEPSCPKTTCCRKPNCKQP